MKPKSMVVFVAGLFLAPQGCVFHPDMGDRPQCDRDADCAEYGNCACLGGKCVPASAGATCTYTQECELPELLCGDACVDVQTDPDHCGRCDHPCDTPPSPACDDDGEGNAVVVTYLSAGLCVAGDCRYESSTVVCPYGCSEGACLEPCQPGDCDPYEICVDGLCRCGGDGPDCDAAQLCCGSECVDPMTDDTNCGHCDNDCTTPPPATCMDDSTLKVKTPGPCNLGTCQFAEEFTQCPSGCQNDRCLDDPCGGPCVDPPAPWCQGDTLYVTDTVGQCVDGGCDYPLSSTIHCDFGCDATTGTCLPPDCSSDADCAPGETCFDGGCLCGSNPPCSAAQACCDGACVMSVNNPEHCGGCNKPCYMGLPNVWSAECSNGFCDYMCDVGMADCNNDLNDGCETDTLLDPGNCGGCGTDCGNDSCVDGDCWPNVNDTVIPCGPGKTCGAGTFCCVGADGEDCLDHGSVDACDAGHVLFCDNAADCPDGAICCFDSDSFGTACSFDAVCPNGYPTCGEGEDCSADALCSTMTINGTTDLYVCLPR